MESNASNEEVPQEETEEVTIEEIRRVLRDFSEVEERDPARWLREYRAREHRTDLQREHVEKRTRLKEAYAKEAQARWGSGSQEA